MAAKKRIKGPKIHTYVLKVNRETGQVLQAHLEDPISGVRRKINLKASPKGAPTLVMFGPGDRILPSGGGPVIGRLGFGTPVINPPRKATSK